MSDFNAVINLHFPPEWSIQKVGDLKSDEKYSLTMGPFGSNIKAENFVESGVPIIKGTNLNSYRYVDGDFTYLSESKADELRSSNCYPMDLVFTHRGTIGQVGIVPHKEFKRYVVSQSGMKLTVDKSKVNPYFLFYFFKSKPGQHQLLKNESQVGVPSISSPLQSLRDVEVPVPPLEEQNAIAEVLGSIDDKIDLLKRNTATMRDAVDLFFKNWLLEDPVAEWKSGQKVSLEKLLDSVSVTKKFKSDQIVFLNTSDISDGYIENFEYTDVSSLPGQAKKSVKKNDILFSEIRPENKRFAYVDFDADDFVVSTKLMVLRGKGQVKSVVLFFYLTNSDNLQWLQMLAESRSGTFPQITYDQVKTMSINLPTGKVLDHLTDWLESVMDKMMKNNKQIKNLEQLRDTLLPKLISGEVRASN